MSTLRTLFAGTLFATSAAGVAYLAFALQRTLAFGRRTASAVERGQFTPPVTVLKPLCGAEPGLFENLSSFCEQDYPDFQVIFGVRDRDDAAIATARRVIESFPDRDIVLVVDDRTRAANLKIANLLNMSEKAKHDIFIVADSDVRVGPSYLRCVVAPFADQHVGAVTCLYRSRASDASVSPSAQTIGDLGAMFVNEHFAPSVLVATALSPMDFCLGATMAVSRTALDAIGGFEAIASYLADDQILGKLVRQQGRSVELSSYVVETQSLDPDLASLWEHEVRWARTMHAARPLGYSFSFISYGLPLAIASAFASDGAPAATAMCGVATILRLWLHYATRNALGVNSHDRPWLIPLRDVLGLAVWAAHFFGTGVRWRQTNFSVDRAGRLRSS